MFQQLANDLTIVLSSLVGTRCAAANTTCEDQTVSTSIFEPLQDLSPELWVGAAARHLAEIATNCNDIQRDCARISEGITRGVWAEDSGTSLWGCVQDTRFHAFSFQLYSDMVREKIVSISQVDSRFLRPVRATPTRSSIHIDHTAMAEYLATHTPLPQQEARLVARDMRDLAKLCGLAGDAVVNLAQAPETQLRAVYQSFAHVQRVMLNLACILLRADVSAGVLMYHLG